MKVWIDGRVVDAADARIGVMDHGLLYGDGVFEGIRCHNRKIGDLDLHLARLATSAKALRLQCPDAQELRSIVLQTAAALGAPDCYLRLVLTRGVGALGIDTSTCPTPGIFCIAGALQLYCPPPGGIRLLTVSLRRPDPDMLDPRVKSLNYLNNVLAKQEARERGADEALLLNRRGTISEAAGANVFCILDDVLCTPPASDGALAGITRRRVMRLARDEGISVDERTLTRFDLLGSSEAFLTGTGAGIVSVGSLDGRSVGEGSRVADLLRDRMSEYLARFGTPLPNAEERPPASPRGGGDARASAAALDG